MNTSTLIYYPKYYHQFGIIQGVLNKISFPYIFVIGFVGVITNTSTVVLLSKNFITKNLRNKWTLIALALSDLLFNIALLIRGVHDISNEDYDRLCRIISFLSHLAELLSACYTVSFTIQRYTAVCYPLKAAVGDRSSPIISILIVFILSSLFCFILSYENPFIDCHEELHLIWFIADALSSFIIPFFLISLFNILIMNFIRKHSRSPISVQSTLARKKKQLRNNYKTYNHDETLETDIKTTINANNSMIIRDENENIELKTKKDEQILNNEIDRKAFRSSTASSSDQLNFESSLNFRPVQTVYRMPVLSRPSSQQIRYSSHDSFTCRILAKSSSQSNENELFATISTRTSQSIRVTRILLLVSSCFLILNAPAHICVIALKIYSNIDSPTSNEHIDHVTSLNNQTLISSLEHLLIIEDKLTPHLLYMAVYLTQCIAYASYSINFFLYSFSGIAFRTNLRQLINKLRRHS